MDASGKPGASFFVGQGLLAPSNAVVAVWGGASYALGA